MMKNRKTAVIILFVAAVVLVAGCAYLVFNSLAESQVVTSTPTPVGAITPSRTGSNAINTGKTSTTGTTLPKGIFQFSSHNAATNADNPALQGTNLVYYWSQLEPQQGQYNWSRY